MTLEDYLCERFRVSPAEYLVIDHLLDGCSNLQIANVLGITEKTVKFHVTNVLKKIGVKTRLEAAVMLLRLDPDEEIVIAPPADRDLPPLPFGSTE